MADDGIFVNVLPALDMVAMATVATNMRRIFGGLGKDLSEAFGAPRKAVEDLSRTMVEASQKAADAQVVASKRAAEAQIADAQAVTAAEEAEQLKRQRNYAAAQRMDQGVFVAQQAAREEATKAAEDATKASEDATAATAAHAEAAAAASAATSRAWNSIGQASAIATAAVVGGTAMIAGNWEQMMTRIQVAGQVPAAQIKSLSDGLLNLSATMGVQQKDIANASLMLSKAGDQYKDTATQVGILKSAIELAKTEGADLTTVVQQMTTSFTDFNIPVGQAANVASMIQIAASNAKRPLDEFVGSLHNVEPAAAAALDHDTGLPQLLTVMSQMASQGAGMDQATQNLNNFLSHLNVFNSPQRSIIGSLGLDATQLTEDLKKPNGLLNVLAQVREAMGRVTTGTGDNAMINLGLQYNNPDVTQDMSKLYGALNPQQKKAANQLLQANSAGVDVTPAQYRSIRAAKAGGGDFPAWYNDFLKTTGPTDLVKQGLPTELPLNTVYEKFGGSQSAYRSFNAILGNPTDPNDKRWQETNQRYSDVKNARPDANGDINGWFAVTQTFNQQLSVLKATMEQLGEATGQKLLPSLETFIKGITGFVQFLNGHQGALDIALKTVETIAEIWASQKIIGGLTTFATRMSTMGGDAVDAESKMGRLASGIGKLGAIGTTVAVILEAAKAVNDEADKLYHVSHDQGLDSFLKGHGLGFLVPENGDTPPPPTTPGTPAAVGAGTGVNARQNFASPSSGAADPATAATGAPAGTPGDPLNVVTPGAGGAAATSPTPPAVPDNIADMLGGGMGGVDGSDDGTSSSAAPYDAFKSMGKGGVKGLIPQLTQLATTFLAELALGNPHAKLFGSGDGSDGQGGDADSGLGDLPSADQIAKMGPAELKNMEGMVKLKKAIRDYHKALRTYARAITQHGSNSEQAANALDGVFDAKGNIEAEVGNEQGTWTTAQQKLADDDANGVSDSSPGQYAKDKAAASAQPAYASAGSMGQSQDQVASAIIQEGQKRGLSRDQIIAGLNVAKLESNYGANPASRVHQNQNGTDVEGIFQQDPGYSGNHDDPHNAAGQYFDRMIARAKPGQSAGQEAVNVQQGTYGGDYVDSQGQGGVYDRLVGGASAAPPSGSPGSPGSLLHQLLNQFLPGHGQGPVFKRSPSDPSYGPPGYPRFGPQAPGYGLTWKDGQGWVSSPAGYGVGIPLGEPGDPGQPGGGYDGGIYGSPVSPPSQGPGGAGGPFAPGGALSAVGRGSILPSSLPMAGSGAGAKPNFGQGAGTPAQTQPQGQGNGAGFSASAGGGLLGAAVGAAGMAADAFAPGSSAAIQIGMQEAERLAGYAGQAGGILASGAIDSLHVSDPDGNQVGSGKGWLSKLAGGIGGSHSSPGSGGGNAAGSSAAPLKPGDAKDGKDGKSGQGADSSSPGLNVTNNFHGTNDNAAKVNQTINQGFMMNPGGGL